MKLCFIATQGGEYGGSEVLWYMTAKEALLKEIKVLISAHASYLEHSQLKELVSLGAELHIRDEVDLSKVHNKVIFKLRCYLPWLNKFTEVKKFQPDLIIVSQRGTYDAAAQLMLFRFLISIRFPFILISQFHKENKAQLHKNVKQRAVKVFKTAKRIYFVSNRNKIASEATIGCPITNASIINNPIKLKVNEIGWPSEDILKVACVARINFDLKRQNALIHTLAQEKWRGRNIELNLYGEGPDSSALKELTQEHKLDNIIKIHGQVEDIKQIWENNHLFILPSMAEGLPLALIEANLFSRAAITTKVGDNEKLVLQDKTGFLIHDLSEQAIDSALEEAWEKRKEWKRLGVNAKAHALEVLDINIHKTLLSEIVNLANE